MEAAEFGNLGAARLLLENGADVNRRQMDEGSDFLRKYPGAGEQPIHFAVAQLRESERANARGRRANHEMVELLLDAGADVDALTFSTDLLERRSIGQTPLMCATGHTEIETVVALLRRGASLDVRDSWGHDVHQALEAHAYIYEQCEYSTEFRQHLDVVRDFIAQVHRSGSWAKYVKAHERVLLLRVLCERGRATPLPATPPHLSRLFEVACPRDVLQLVLEYWRYQR